MTKLQSYKKEIKNDKYGMKEVENCYKEKNSSIKPKPNIKISK